MVKRRWDPSSSSDGSDDSDDSSTNSTSSGSELEELSEMTLTPEQKEYLEIGADFLEMSKLAWWFEGWDPSIPFNYASDCSLFALKDVNFTMQPLCQNYFIQPTLATQVLALKHP